MSNIYIAISTYISKLNLTRSPRLLMLISLFLLSSAGNLLAQRHLYTYSGAFDPEWNGTYTWTDLPGGGDINNSDPYVPLIPEPGDILHILNNKMVYLPGDISLSNLTIIIYNGGLDLRNHTLTGITELRQNPDNQGTLRISRANYFPAITTNNFTSAPGSTVEYYNFTGTIPANPTTYYNLLVNNTDGGNHNVILDGNITITNDLNIERTASAGTMALTIGNSATVRAISARNLTVGANSTLQTGNFNAIHNITVGGNLTNNGSIRLTNQATRYQASTNGAAVLTFTGADNNILEGTGPQLRLYRLIIDKGTDQSFVLDANPLNFELWYRTDLGNGGSDPNPVINKALWIKNGTLKLGSNINIEKLADQDQQNSGSDFFIPLNGSLWIDGATVNITDNNGNADNTGLTVIGKLLVTDGILNTNKSAGIVFREQAVIEIRGGTTTISQFCQTSSGGTHLATFIMSGGTLNVNGGGENNDTYARFSLPLSTQSFRMSGGTINLSSPNNAGILSIGSDPANNNVTGGTINISHTGTCNIASTSPMFNLNVESGTLAIADVENIGLQPLKVNNNLTLGNNTTLNTNDQDLWIAGNFTIGTGANYTHGSNTTHFFRYGAANNAGTTITNNGATPLSLNHVSINKADLTATYNNAKTVYFPGNGNPAVNITGSLNFDSPYQTLDLNNSRLRIQGNITVSQYSRIVNDPANGILLQPGSAQPQILNLGRLTSANNFEINNTADVRLNQSAAMNTILLTNGSLYTGNKRLTLNQPVSGTGFSASKMISTNGSSGELRYKYSGPGAGTYLYPAGSGAAPLEDGEEELDWSEDFSRDVFSTAPLWENQHITNTSNWNVNAGSARFNANNTHETRMVSPVIDLSGYTSVTLTFSEQRPRANGQVDELTVEYYNGTSWIVLETYTNRQENFITRTITLPPGAITTGFRIGFRALSNHNNTTTRVDNVQLTNIIETENKKYTPFTNIITNTGSFDAGENFIGVIPVNKNHPLYITGQEDQILYYHWKTTRGGGQTGLTFEFRFNFYDEDKIQGGGGGTRRAFKLISNEWFQGTSYDATANATDPTGLVTFANTGFNQGDFTAGTQNAFSSGGGLTTYYSRNATSGGDWETGTSWSTDDDLGHAGAAAGASPGVNDQVIIAPNHTITITTATRRANLVMINEAGVLNLGTTTGHEFGQIRGDGTLRTASATLPVTSDNLEEFTHTDNSTIEFYGTTNYTIPALEAYYNLHITGTGTKTLPATDLHIRNNLYINQSPTLISSATSGNLEIEGELQVNNGATLTIPATTNQRTINTSNITIDNATFATAAGTGTTHHININGGGIILNGATAAANLFTAANNVNLTLTGPGNTAISGSNGNNVSLNRLIINKPSLFEEISVTANLMLNSPTDGTPKALELNTGTLILERTQGATAINITLSSGGASFSIPSTAALIVRGTGNIVSTSGTTGISLDGLLEIKDTGQALFNGGNNDIVYTSSGNAAITVADGAVLNVGGQIRRNTSQDNAIISYTQTGGTVSIGTMGASTGTRGVFEVLNEGSSFTHTDGSLTIGRTSGNASGDILLAPHSGNISGTATLTINAAAAAQTIKINSTIPLNNLTIEGNNSPTVQPVTRRLSLAGNLSINTGATYTSNNLSLSIGGNYINNGTFTSSTTDTTLFTGTVQTLSGNGTNTFHHFVSEPETSLDIQRAITTGGNLAINSGDFRDNGHTITTRGNVYNSGVHSGAGKILLNGTTRQDLGGGGTFGNLELNNTAGSQLISNITIAGNLHLENGILNIRNNRLSLLAATQITAQGSTFGPTRMIQTNGDMGDAGIQKTFSPGSTNFTFPIGSFGKYTPVVADFPTFSGGTINIYPVNSVHPVIIGSGDPAKVLQYYWGVFTNGITNATGSLVFHYDPNDLRGDLAEYSSAQLLLSNDTWTKAAMPADDKLANRITFNYTDATDEFLQGSFLCGEETAIPDVVSVYSTIDSGNWDTPAIWNTGSVPPQGVIVVIQNNHTVNITTDRKRVYRMRLNGRLELSPTTLAHNFGLVEGTGTLALQAGNLPPGKWSEIFLTCEGGTVEFGGTGSYTLDDRYLHYRNLTITGDGTKTSPNIADLIICGNLHIKQEVNFYQRHRTTYKENITMDLGGAFSHRGWWTNVDGAAKQTISGDFTGNNTLKSLDFLNPNGYEIGNDIEVSYLMKLSSGRIRNMGHQLSYMSSTGLSYEKGGTSDTYITGRYRRLLEPSTSNSYYFPVGKPERKKVTGVLQPSTTGNQLWAIEYFDLNPDSEGLTITNVLSPLGTVSVSEYWVFNGPNGGSAKIELPLTGTSEVAAALGEANKEDIRIVRWDNINSRWEIVGDGVIFFGSVGDGTITTMNPVTFNGADQYFTLGTPQDVTIPTANISSLSTSICAGGTYNLEVTLTGVGPWEIQYSDGTITSGWITVDSHTPIPLSPTSTTTYTLTAVRDAVDGIVFGDPITLTLVPFATIYTVDGGGSICGIQTTNVTLSGSQIGYTYQLFRNVDILVMEQTGTGSGITFGPISIEGTYTIKAYATGSTGCINDMSGEAIVTIVEGASAVITGLVTGETICEGEPVTLSLEITASQPFDLTIAETSPTSTRFFNLTHGDLTFIGGNTYQFNLSVPPVWVDQGNTTPGLSIYTYSFSNFTDTSGCSATFSGETSVNVFKIPETGPQYHIPNTFGN